MIRFVHSRHTDRTYMIEPILNREGIARDR